MSTRRFLSVGLCFLTVLAAGCQAEPAAAPAGPTDGFGGTVRIDKGLKGEIYPLPEGATALPQFDTLKPIGTVWAQTLDVPDRDFREGFPGVTDRYEWFAIRYRGAVEVDRAGRYEFRLSSDDGSRLLIDGHKVVDNDGQHPTNSASGGVSLTPGRHTVEVQYFQGPAVRVSLQLFCTRPGGAEAVFPGCGLSLAKADEASPGAVPWIYLIVAVLIIGGLVIVILRRRRPSPQASEPIL